MRKNILAVGVILLALALFGLSYPPGLLFSVPISLLNIALGLITRMPSGIPSQQRPGNVKLVVDRAVVRASVYELIFLDARLIFKRLSSVGVTVILALLLAVAGLKILFIIGALMGGITGFSLQEFLTQRKRDKIDQENELTTVAKRDIQIDFDDLVEVRLIKNRLLLITDSFSISANLPRGYSNKLRQVLEDTFDSKFTSEESIRSRKAAEKEYEKSKHSGRDSSKFSRSQRPIGFYE